MSDFTTDLDFAWRSNRFIILDTETTGLRYPAEIIQISIRDFMGAEIFSSFLNPLRPIPPDATRIHGITNEQVQDAPTWPKIREQVWDLVHGKHVLVYNAEFDFSMLQSTDRVWSLAPSWNQSDSDWICVMKWYAPFAGQWDDYHGNYRWQKLADACSQQGIIVDNAHNASGDTLMTYELVKAFMVRRAKGEIIYKETGNFECEHSTMDDTANGDKVCRDCGYTRTV